MTSTANQATLSGNTTRSKHNIAKHFALEPSVKILFQNVGKMGILIHCSRELRTSVLIDDLSIWLMYIEDPACINLGATEANIQIKAGLFRGSQSLFQEICQWFLLEFGSEMEPISCINNMQELLKSICYMHKNTLNFETTVCLNDEIHEYQVLLTPTEMSELCMSLQEQDQLNLFYESLSFDVVNWLLSKANVPEPGPNGELTQIETPFLVVNCSGTITFKSAMSLIELRAFVSLLSAG
ncbi:hypothetical protein BJ741DRAFT_113213 [Chytriomyces cf. hyalinus JEL632]|nr:hypothetical protein BJ741DRAFT_113213 [Chytriomyces cf. hyalinus JEL632]